MRQLVPQTADTDNLPEGSRWLHMWTVTSPDQVQLWLAIQYETVGVAISAAPGVPIEPTAALALFDQLARLPGAVRVPEGVSLRLD